MRELLRGCGCYHPQRAGDRSKIVWGGSSMKKEFSVVIEKDEDGYFVGSVPELRGCHTQARSLDELMERVKEAILLCLEVEGVEKEGLEFIGVQRVMV